jgi:hypothetical protein
VEEWRRRDPIASFSKRLVDDGMFSEDDMKKFDDEAMARVDESVQFADNSPFPDLDSLYDDLYVFGHQVKSRGWFSVDERSPEPHRGEEEREAGRLPHELAEAGAAYAGVGEAQERKRRQRQSEGGGEPETSGTVRDEEGGAD